MQIARHGAIELAYETCGAPGGEPLLLISGTGMQMLMWRTSSWRPSLAAGLRDPLRQP